MEKIIEFFKNFWQKANKKKLIAAAIVLGIVIVATIGLSIFLNSPTILAARTASKFAKDLSKRDEISTITDTITQGSLQASLSSVSIDDEEMLEDFSASGKIYFGETSFMLENLNISYDEFDISGNVYLSPDLIYVQEDEYIGGAYGIERENFANDLDNSIFAYGSGSPYSLFHDEEMYNALLESLDASQDEKMIKDAEKIIKKYTKTLYKSFVEHGEITVEKDKVKIDGKNTAVRIITISINEKAAAAVAEDMLNFIIEDNSIVEFLEKYESKLSILNYALSAYVRSDSEDIISLYEELIEELEESIDDIVDGIEDTEFNVDIEMVTPRNSAKLLKLELKSDGEKIATLDVGAKGVKNSQKITLSAAGGYKIVYEIKEKTNKIYKSTLKANGEQILSVDIDYGKNEYKITAGDGDATVKGEISKKGKTINLSVDKIEYTQYDYWYGEETTVTIKTDLELVIKTKDKMPKAPTDFTTIDQITEEDIEEWAKKFDY